MYACGLQQEKRTEASDFPQKSAMDVFIQAVNFEANHVLMPPECLEVVLLFSHTTFIATFTAVRVLLMF